MLPLGNSEDKQRYYGGDPRSLSTKRNAAATEEACRATACTKTNISSGRIEGGDYAMVSLRLDGPSVQITDKGSAVLARPTNYGQGQGMSLRAGTSQRHVACTGPWLS
jgi:hypothetical protein